jgi:pteridine reductase
MRKRRRVALVTGGASRVGRAIVERLASEGYLVAFTWKSSQRKALQLVRRFGSGVRPFEIDLTQPESAAFTAMLKSVAELGPLHVLVNNASIYEPGDERIRQMFKIHVQAPRALCRVFAPMLRQSRGHVINMLDLLAERPWPRYAAYCASKAALWNLTLSLARELAPQVTVNGIAPGVVAWPDDFPKAERDKYLKRVPLARAGTPQDVANLVHFLATEGSYITGQIIRLDGGRSIA